ncbi:MAG: YicC family protein [Rikenellaceae bacterium]|nr:YicC family protein [Rikenellaceae bacterium]MBQ5371342.1 YicC family protein [Rikenellaceae bacterium]MBQ5852992.1 YicC family protein [Rikenellaceae bacterium]
MTGYGKAESATQNKKISVEIRSLNSKQLDLSIKLPAIYRPFEYEIRNKIAQTVKRGKVDVYINTETTVDEGSVKINGELFKIHYNAIKAICADNNISSSAEIDATLIQSVMRLPDVVATDSNDISEDEQKALMEAVTAATAQHDAFRTQEGAILIADLLHRVDKIEALKEAVTPFEKARVEAIRTKIHEAIEQLKVEVDNNRLEQEMIFYIEKLDVTEEKVRLTNHCKYFREVAAGEEAPGRKLGFIAQEMGREINTLGSKSNDSQMQRLVVQMKDELEKIKEQVLNLL